MTRAQASPLAYVAEQRRQYVALCNFQIAIDFFAFHANCKRGRLRSSLNQLLILLFPAPQANNIAAERICVMFGA